MTSYLHKKGTKIKKGAKGRVVEVHPLHRLNPKTKEEVWAVNVEIDPPHAKPDDNLIEDIRKADYKRSLEETDFI